MKHTRAAAADACASLEIVGGLFREVHALQREEGKLIMLPPTIAAKMYEGLQQYADRAADMMRFMGAALQTKVDREFYMYELLKKVWSGLLESRAMHGDDEFSRLEWRLYNMQVIWCGLLDVPFYRIPSATEDFEEYQMAKAALQKMDSDKRAVIYVMLCAGRRPGTLLARLDVEMQRTIAMMVWRDYRLG